jgi:hypothetical protein
LRKVATLLIFLVAFAGYAPPTRGAETLQLVEQEIKAGLLYNFLKYTDWPQNGAVSADSPMIVCLLGGDPFSGRLQPMAGRTVNQHVIQVKNAGTLAEAADCSLVFINTNMKPQWPELHTELMAKPMLTVGDFDGFSDSGGMIEFTRTDNRIGVKINTGALAAAHLQVQDRLLKLASVVTGGAAK